MSICLILTEPPLRKSAGCSKRTFGSSRVPFHKPRQIRRLCAVGTMHGTALVLWFREKWRHWWEQILRTKVSKCYNNLTANQTCKWVFCPEKLAESTDYWTWGKEIQGDVTDRNTERIRFPSGWMIRPFMMKSLWLHKYFRGGPYNFLNFLKIVGLGKSQLNLGISATFLPSLAG